MKVLFIRGKWRVVFSWFGVGCAAPPSNQKQVIVRVCVRVELSWQAWNLQLCVFFRYKQLHRPMLTICWEATNWSSQRFGSVFRNVTVECRSFEWIKWRFLGNGHKICYGWDLSLMIVLGKRLTSSCLLKTNLLYGTPIDEFWLHTNFFLLLFEKYQPKLTSAKIL